MLEFKHEAANGTETITKPSGTAAQPSNVSTTGTASRPPPEQTGNIGYAKAKSIALNHAGISESTAYDTEVEPDDEDGVPICEMSFKSGNFEKENCIPSANAVEWHN